MSKFRLHINESAGGKSTTFSRDDNGMIVGFAQEGMARFGEDPSTPVVRAFVDHHSAILWMKEQCRKLCGREDVDFIEVPQGQIMPAMNIPNMRKM